MSIPPPTITTASTVSASTLPCSTAVSSLLQPLLPIRGLKVALVFTRTTETPFFHQASLTAFLRHLLGSPKHYEDYLCIDTPESSRLNYQTDDTYTFTVFGIPGCEALLAQLIDKLIALPDSCTYTGPKLAFSNNITLHKLCDLWQGNEVKNIDDLIPWQPFAEAKQWLSTTSSITIRWLAPVRLLKAKPQHNQPKPAASKQPKPYKGEQRFCRGDLDIDATLWLARLFDTYTALLRRLGRPQPSRPRIPAITAINQHQFWLDSNYQGPNGKTQAMGGMSGEFCVASLPAAWLPLIVLGQYLGIGQFRAFGWGRYRIEDQQRKTRYTRSQPDSTIMSRAQQLDNLQTAAQAIAAKSEQPHQYQSPEKLHWLQNKLPQWQAPELHGVLISKDNGEPRALAIAPTADRILQRAVAQIITPAIDRLLAPSSYGYRRGRSRLLVAEAIQKAWRDGYRWVYESDIDDFFDSINRQHVYIRLRCLFGDDPIIKLIMAWMSAAVIWDEHRVERQQGVPQGSPLSPVLTNLLLDDFDRDMADAGFKMLRFADDFVVLCRSQEHVKQAHAAATKSLADVDLALNADKTHQRSFAQGFKYLGYLFMNDLVVHAKGNQSLRAEKNSPATSTLITHQHSKQPWLTRLAQHNSHAIAPDGELNTSYLSTNIPSTSIPPNSRTNTSVANPPPTVDHGARKQANNAHHIGHMNNAGTMVLVAGDPCVVSSRSEQLWVTRDDKDISRTPWHHVSAIVLIGMHHITTPAITHALKQNVCTHFISRGGRYQGASQAPPQSANIFAKWQAQAEAFADTDRAMSIAKQLVSARIRHMRNVLRLQNQDSLNAIQLALKDDLRQVAKCQNRQQLNGYEGTSTKRYFAGLQGLIDAQWGFNKRNRRPPKDPVNAMLSLGYSILFAHTQSMLHVSGLWPWLGCYHQNHGNHATLASDMMEPFRHMVEQVIVAMINRQQIALDDFHPSDDKQGIWMVPTARSKFIAALEKRLMQPIKSIHSDKAMGLYDHLHAQNTSLQQWIDQQTEFKPFLIR